MRTILSLIAILFFANAAQAFQLEFPVACNFGVDCFVQNYVDVDPSPEWQDFACGKLSYNGHDGTDIRVRDFTVMERGVAVKAAADGVVFGMRDGVEDTGREKPEAYGQMECGNAVVIDHAEGWQTTYCHMKKGSVRVQKGQRVKAGDVIGQIGYSGNTEFPHLHITVRHNRQVIDPFTGLAMGSNQCGVTTDGSIWDKQLGMRYIPTVLLNASFATQTPDMAGIEHGKFKQTHMPKLAKDAPYLLAWVEMMGVQEGDTLQIRIYGPNGGLLLTRDEAYANPKARQFNYAGIKCQGASWLPGAYTGTVTLMRGGQAIAQQNLSIAVDK